jgi:hypothetical protein
MLSSCAPLYVEPSTGLTAKLIFDKKFSTWALSSYFESGACKQEIALNDVVHYKADRSLKFNVDRPITIYATYLGVGSQGGMLASITCKTATSFKPKNNVIYYIEAHDTPEYCSINVYEQEINGKLIPEISQVKRKMLHKETKETKENGHCEPFSSSEKSQLGI